MQFMAFSLPYDAEFDNVLLEYDDLEYNIQIFTIEMTERKP